VFADTFSKLENIKEKTNESRNFEDLLLILVSDQIGEL
jgi:hypothetical protein